MILFNLKIFLLMCFFKGIDVSDFQSYTKYKEKNEFLIPQVFSIGKLNIQVLYAHIFSPINH